MIAKILVSGWSQHSLPTLSFPFHLLRLRIWPSDFERNSSTISKARIGWTKIPRMALRKRLSSVSCYHDRFATVQYQGNKWWSLQANLLTSVLNSPRTPPPPHPPPHSRPPTTPSPSPILGLRLSVCSLDLTKIVSLSTVCSNEIVRHLRFIALSKR